MSWCSTLGPHAVSDLWSLPLALPGPPCPSDGYVPCRVQRTWGTWRRYSWQFLEIPLHWLSSAHWVKRRISWLSCTLIIEWEGSTGEGKWFVCNLNLIYSNLVMAEMDLSVLYGPCLVVLLTTRAKSRVTGSALGQLGQRWKDGELSPGVRPTRQGEASKSCCQELRAMMAPPTILDISLPPKHLTCSISQYTNKQTHTHSHKHADAKGCLES